MRACAVAVRFVVEGGAQSGEQSIERTRNPLHVLSRILPALDRGLGLGSGLRQGFCAERGGGALQGMGGALGGRHIAFAQSRDKGSACSALLLGEFAQEGL